MFSSSSPPPPPLSVVRAWTCLGINLFATPGLGSYWGGRRAAGRAQMFFAFLGFCLLVYWMFKMSFGIANSEVTGDPAPNIPSWIWELGVLSFAIGWVWSFITSISLLIEVSRRKPETPGAVPPKLSDLN